MKTCTQKLITRSQIFSQISPFQGKRARCLLPTMILDLRLLEAKLADKSLLSLTMVPDAVKARSLLDKWNGSTENGWVSSQ